MELISVAALAENRVIGRDGEIPWPSIPADKQQYRERIADSAVILGRVTFDSMRGDLPGTYQIVLSRADREYEIDSASLVSSVDEAISTAETLGANQAYVIGGADIYALFQPVIDRMVLSRIPGEYEGDAYYPDWDREEWNRVNQVEFDQFTLEEWTRE